MAEYDMFGSAGAPFEMGNGAPGFEEDPAAAFLAQQESEIAGIENDEGFNILESGQVPDSLSIGGGGGDAVDGFMNGDYYQEANGPTDGYSAISHADRLQSEPESIRKWREEQKDRLEALDANSKKQESEWKEKAVKELEEWYSRQDELLQKTKVNNRHPHAYNLISQRMVEQEGQEDTEQKSIQAAEEAFVSDIEETTPGTEWERVARLCDFNPKSSKQSKDVSRMRSVLISLKQAPLVR